MRARASQAQVERKMHTAKLDEAVQRANEHSMYVQWTPDGHGGFVQDRDAVVVRVSLVEAWGFGYQWSVTPKDGTQHMAHCEDSAELAILIAEGCAYGWHIGRETAN